MMYGNLKQHDFRYTIRHSLGMGSASVPPTLN